MVFDYNYNLIKLKAFEDYPDHLECLTNLFNVYENDVKNDFKLDKVIEDTGNHLIIEGDCITVPTVYSLKTINENGEKMFIYNSTKYPSLIQFMFFDDNDDSRCFYESYDEFKNELIYNL